MGLITDFWFGLAKLFKWLFENTLVPIGVAMDWILFIVGLAMIAWWLFKLAQFGNNPEKDYDGI